jgi:coenzyme F420-0:L-glutamate ligase/coenzyme F420-1:gamma-L-glutamate ligase
MILIPVKNLGNAKQRLSAVLDRSTRTELAHAMLEDVLQAVFEARVDQVALVTSDGFAIGLAAKYGFEVIPDTANRGETDAIEMATRVCEERGIETTLVIPGDIPLVEAADLRTIHEHAPASGSVLVPSSDERGTNAVLRRPAALFPLRFGNDSFVPHLTAAKATGQSSVVLSLPRIALDIDTPEDLCELAQAPGEKRAQLLARRLRFGEGRRNGADEQPGLDDVRHYPVMAKPVNARSAVTLLPVSLREDIFPGDNLVEKLSSALRHQKMRLQAGDILVIKHKIVSKAEGRMVQLRSVKPTRAARAWAKRSGADARVAQLSLDQSRSILRQKMIAGRGVLITETHHGLICANSGVDLSNVDGGECAVMLPEDPDKSAARLRAAIKKKFGVAVAVIISDSFGRPWREGLTEVAIGVAGMKALRDDRDKRDSHGYVLHASVEAVADEVACAAGLVCGKLNRTPICIVRGVSYQEAKGSGRELIRPRKNDLFR